MTSEGASPGPWLYGDAINIPPVDSPRQYSVLTPTQLRFLQQWSDGDCLNDYDPGGESPRRIEDVPIAEPMVLTRAPSTSAWPTSASTTWPRWGRSIAPIRASPCLTSWALGDEGS